MELYTTNIVGATLGMAWMEHPTLSDWSPSTIWTWEGGEALTVQVGSSTWFMVRQGEEIKTIEAESIRQALKFF